MPINRILVIGLGSIGKRHLRLARELMPDADIRVLRHQECATNPEYTDGCFSSLEKALFFNPQIAVIANPAPLHMQVALPLARAGVHLLIEKPLSQSLQNVDKLLNCVTKQGYVGLVGYCLRYDPAAVKFKEKLCDGKIGKILHVQVDCGSYLPDWRQGQDYRQSVSANKKLGGGVLLELSHEIDYVRWFFGDLDDVSAILVNSNTLDIDVEDSAEMVFSSPQGFTIAVHLDFNSRSNRRSCKVRGTEGDLIWDAVSQKVAWMPTGKPDEVETFQHERNFIYREQLKHFFDCIENDQSPRVTFKDGAETLRIVEAARESSATGKKVVLG
jgi:predicted dehydrogenase